MLNYQIISGSFGRCLRSHKELTKWNVDISRLWRKIPDFFHNCKTRLVAFTYELLWLAGGYIFGKLMDKLIADITRWIRGKLSTVTFVFDSGWNMVSIPIIPNDKNANSVFPDSAGVYTWDPVKGGYVTPKVIKPGVAYWVLYLEPKRITVKGRPVSRLSLRLAQGWNMVGVATKEVKFTNLSHKAGESIIPGTLYGFDSVSCLFIPKETIEPTRGYWIASWYPSTMIVEDH